MIRFDDVTKDFSGTVVGPVAFAVAAGELVALTGANGTGKSTMVAIAAGEIRPTSGSFTVDGFGPLTAETKARLAICFDRPDFYDGLTLRDHVELMARLHASSSHAASALEMISELGLSNREHDLPSRFSFGMKKKAGLALAFARPFTYAVLDEPTTGVDDSGVATILRTLADARSHGFGVLVTTHDQRLLQAADRTVTLQ